MSTSLCCRSLFPSSMAMLPCKTFKVWPETQAGGRVDPGLCSRVGASPRHFRTASGRLRWSKCWTVAAVLLLRKERKTLSQEHHSGHFLTVQPLNRPGPIRQWQGDAPNLEHKLKSTQPQEGAIFYDKGGYLRDEDPLQIPLGLATLPAHDVPGVSVGAELRHKPISIRRHSDNSK